MDDHNKTARLALTAASTVSDTIAKMTFLNKILAPVPAEGVASYSRISQFTKYFHCLDEAGLQEACSLAIEYFLLSQERLFLEMASTRATATDSISYFSGPITPKIMSVAQNEIMQWSFPASHVLVAMDILPDLQAGPFDYLIDHETRKSIIVGEGRFGTMFGMGMLTDGYRSCELHVLDIGQSLVFAAPALLGFFKTSGVTVAPPMLGDDIDRGFRLSMDVSIGLRNHVADDGQTASTIAMATR